MIPETVVEMEIVAPVLFLLLIVMGLGMFRYNQARTFGAGTVGPPPTLVAPPKAQCN